MGKRTLLSFVGTALFVAALSGTAWAHPAYKASSPPSGGSVSQPPSELWVEFTETIEGGQVEVFDPCGEQVDNGDSTQNLTNDRVTVTMSASRAGTYRVDWSVLGSDGHPTRGSFTFSASSGEPCPGLDPPQEREPREGGGGPVDRGSRSETQRTDDGQATQARSVGAGRERAREQGGQNDVRPNRQSRTEPRVGGAREGVTGPQGASNRAPTSDPGIWDGIPMGDFLMALGVAAVIGAAGGRIYAGIMGPAPRR